MASVFDLAALRPCFDWARPFSLPEERFVRPALVKPAAARALGRYLPSRLSRLIRSFCFSICEFESSRRSEIDPEDSPKSPPALRSGAHRRSKYPCKAGRRSRHGQALRKCPPHVTNVNSGLRDELPASAGASPAVSRASRNTFGKLFGGGAEKGGRGARAPARAV